jgi:hypothetical protein
MKRDELRWHAPTEGTRLRHIGPVTDADLAALGYVKLDHIDVEALRKALIDSDAVVRETRLSLVEARALDEVWQVARQVLTALDPQEDTDV